MKNYLEPGIIIETMKYKTDGALQLESRPDAVDGYDIAADENLPMLVQEDSDTNTISSNPDYGESSYDPEDSFALFGAPKHQNFLIIYGTEPAGSVLLETQMINDLLLNWERKQREANEIQLPRDLN